jgi:hypothetical protein
MDYRKVAREFYREFEKMNLKGVLSFFAPHAMVHSPTLGKKEASVFYAELFSKTIQIKVVIKDLFVNPDNPHRLAAYVNFEMTWKGEAKRSGMYEGVAIFDLNAQGKIQHVEVIYDAERAREEMAKIA